MNNFTCVECGQASSNNVKVTGYSSFVCYSCKESEVKN
jgi:hypothetical protein